MEVRASYLLVGAVVLALLGALAALSVWLVKADVDGEVARYEIAFAGTVSGLREGGQVLYRGIPVGRAGAIRIDPANVEQVLVTVEIERSTPIKADTVATIEMQGITGLAYVQLSGGTQASARLDPDAVPPPRIAARRSSLERMFEWTPQLLNQSMVLAERLTRLLEDDNIAAISAALGNLERLTATLAARSGEIDALLVGAGGAALEVQALAADLRRLTASLEQGVATMSGEASGTLGALRATAGTLDGLVEELHQPLDDFANTGLYELTQLVGETRQLIAALGRITAEFERDPAGFLIGGRGGFEAE
jgi:phospholipid/cholesterol/gamma-HCH transport system substrate-binding protein